MYTPDVVGGISRNTKLDIKVSNGYDECTPLMWWEVFRETQSLILRLVMVMMNDVTTPNINTSSTALLGQ